MVVSVLRAPAGSGKTHAYVQKIANKPADMQFEVYVPTIKLAEEIKASIDALGTAHRVSVIKGRDQVGAAGQPLCVRHVLAGELAAKGISVYPNLCMRRTTAGTAECPHFASCAYVAQYQRCNVRIYTHAHLLVGRTMLDKAMPSIVLIDEDFTRQLIEEVNVSMAIVRNVSATLGFTNVMTAVENWRLTRDAVALKQAYEAECATGCNWSDLAQQLRKHGPAISPTDQDQTASQHAKAHLDVRPVATLLEHLDKSLSKGITPSSVDFEPTGLVVHHRHEITRFGDLSDAGAPRVYVVDATISELLIRQCLPVHRFSASTTARNALVYQCSDSPCSNASLLEAKHTTTEKKSRAKDRLADVQALIDELAGSGKPVLVVGPSAITGNPASGVSPLLKAATNVHLAHFSAIRGIDQWKNCEILVLVGRNEPSTKDVENLARAYFYDDPKPIQVTGQWTSRPEGYWMASGEHVGVEVTAHLDHRVHEVLMQIREAESVQALDRLRLVHNDAPKMLIILSKIPLPGVQVEALMDWKTLTRGTEFEQIYHQNGQLLPMNADWIARQTGKTAEAAKSAVRRVRKGHPLLRFYKWSLTLLTPPIEAQYLPAGQKRWSRFWHGLPTLNDARQALEVLLGAAVKVK